MDKMDLTCPQCGAAMAYDQAQRLLRCPHCGRQTLVDDGRVQVDGDSFLEAGYRFEQGRMMAQREAAEEARRQELARQAAAARELKQLRRWNTLCLVLSFLMPFTMFLPKWAALAAAAVLAGWAVADRRIAGTAKVIACCFALPVIAWRLIFG